MNSFHFQTLKLKLYFQWHDLWSLLLVPVLANSKFGIATLLIQFLPHFCHNSNYYVVVVILTYMHTSCFYISGILKHILLTRFHLLAAPRMLPLSIAVHIPEFIPMAITAVMWPCSVPTTVSFYIGFIFWVPLQCNIWGTDLASYFLE